MPYSRSYFLSTTDDDEVQVNVTNELLQTILPHELRGNTVNKACDHIEYHFLKEVWECLAGEKIFFSVIQVVIKMWALLLSTKNTLFCFSSRDQCLPIIPLKVFSESSGIVVSSKETQPLVSNNTERVSNILKELPNVPFLDTNVVPYKVVSEICPQFSKPETILKNLYHVHQINDLTKFMTKDVVKSFIQYLRAINFKTDSTSCRTLGQLPFFETIDENFTHLNRKKVFVWPSRLPRRGCKKWLSGKKSIFLEANGAWSELHVKTELQIVDITEEDIYVQFVFPYFDKMDQTERFIHLEHIRVYLFNTNYENRQNDDKNISESAINFISVLNDLECLENSKKILRPIKSFCDHENKIFITFSYYFCFIPQHFQELKKINSDAYKSWMTFFRKLGLRDTLNSEEYCTLCSDTANGELEGNTKMASSRLVSYLFSHKESEKHKFLTDSVLLKEIATIPFVCCVRSPELEWIHQSCPTNNSIILPDNQEITMCTLEGSCLKKHKELLWTVKPVVNLSSETRDIEFLRYFAIQSALRYLGIETEPGNYVLENINNLSETSFAQPSLFHEYTAPLCKPGQTRLMEVMVKNFKFLNENHDVGRYISCLKNIPCIPVNTHPLNLPVLVKPQHVIFDERMDIFYPFLHSAPPELYSVKPLLRKIGIADSLKFEHVQFMLQHIFEHFHSMEMDPKTLKSVNSALYCLISLLKETKEEEKVIALKLNPLYLLATDKQLHDASKLVYCDNPAYQLYSLDLAETGLYLLQIGDNMLNIKEEEFCALLPKAVRPQPLSLLCSETLSPSCQECPLTEYAQKLQQALQITNLPQAMSRVFRYITENIKLSEEFEEQLPFFFSNIEIVCMNGLEIDITLKYENKEYLVASEPVECHMQKDDTTYRFYLDSDVSDIQYKELLVSISECSILDTVGTEKLNKNCFEKLVSFFESLLRAKNEMQIYRHLIRKQIVTAGLDAANDDSLDCKLGETIPKSLHFMMDQNVHNIFFPQERVGYEKSEGRIVFAEIVFCVNPKDSSLNLSNLKYKIVLSENDEIGIEVSSLRLYKFKKIQKEPDLTLQKSLECASFEGEPSESIVQNLDEIKEEIKREIHDIFEMPTAERKKAIQRLYLKWHPDKNLSNPAIAEEAFKFLKLELERQEQGSESSWQRDSEAWNKTAGEDKYNYQQYYPTSPSGAGGGACGSGTRGDSFTGFFGKGEFTPPKQEAEGKRWIRQAEMDFKTLDTIMINAKINNNLSGNVCFMAHEVAEKALKGGMYAIHGLRDASLKSHQLTPLACALESHTPKAAGLAAHSATLEPYYLNTRFPNCWPSPKIPAEQFSLSAAESAREKARDILEIVNNIV